MEKKITKKEFKELCHNGVYTSRGKRINAFLYGYRDYRWTYMAWCDTKVFNKNELLNHFYNYLIKDIPLPWQISFKKAETDEQRFKIPIVLKG